MSFGPQVDYQVYLFLGVFLLSSGASLVFYRLLAAIHDLYILFQAFYGCVKSFIVLFHFLKPVYEVIDMILKVPQLLVKVFNDFFLFLDFIVFFL